MRTCVSELEGAGDASALERYYHRTCLRSAQRTFTPVFHSNVQVIRTLCDEQLLLSIQTTLSDGVTLNMGELNDAYLLILETYHVEVDETTNYHKHMKQLITEHLPNAQFIKSFRKNEPDNIVLPTAVSNRIYIAFSERLLKHRHDRLQVIACYAPTNSHIDANKDQFYNTLTYLIASFARHDIVVVLGDLNATLGSDRRGYESVLGPHSSGSRNDNGERLLDLCALHRLKITGSWFRRRNMHRWTWISNDGRTKKELDYIII